MNKKDAIKRLDALDREALELKKIIENDSLIDINDINCYKSACGIAGDECKSDPTPEEELKAIIKAANYIDNNHKVWEADFDDSTVKKYIPYFRKTASGWFFRTVRSYYRTSDLPAGLYLRNEDTTKIIAERFLPLYNRWLSS